MLTLRRTLGLIFYLAHLSACVFFYATVRSLSDSRSPFVPRARVLSLSPVPVAGMARLGQNSSDERGTNSTSWADTSAPTPSPPTPPAYSATGVSCANALLCDAFD